MEWLIVIGSLLTDVAVAVFIVLHGLARLRGRGSVLGGVLRRSVSRALLPRPYESSSNSRNRRSLPVLSRVLWEMLSLSPHAKPGSEKNGKEDS